MRRHRRAKIVATVGPASSSPEMLKALLLAGVDTFRLNFSHGTQSDHASIHAAIRRLEQDVSRPIGILMDLQGPKIRVGTLRDGKIAVAAGETIRFVLSGSEGDRTAIPLPHREIFAAVAPGHDLLIDDGRVRVRVAGLGGDFIEAKVIVGGTISNHKGVNLPGTVLDLSPLTAKDRLDLEFGLNLGVDWVALSFVQKPSDIIEARSLVGDRAGLMAKIEKPAALERIDDIIQLCDAIMVARGDLGVEIPHEDVPGRQKELVRACRLAVKPVIVATQMLDSMVAAPTPTRAEVSDVATAIYDGADAVMLSAESDRPLSARGRRDDGPHHPQHRTAQDVSLDRRSDPARRRADAAACGCNGRRRPRLRDSRRGDRGLHVERHHGRTRRAQAAEPADPRHHPKPPSIAPLVPALGCAQRSFRRRP